MTIRVLVVDDQALIRAGLVALLNAAPGTTPVAEAGDGVEAVALVASHQPDVVLMDVRMPVLDGIAATRQILAAPRPPRVIVLTTFDLDEYVYDALSAGAAGFLLKDTPPERIVAAIEAVMSGEVLVAPSVVRRLVSTHAVRRRSAVDAGRDLERLTAREREVLAAVANGLTNAEIATSLVISEETVKTHVKRLMSKLQLASRAQAVVIAYESGLVVAGQQ